MTKLEFLEELKNGLNGLPQNEIEERINFYGEIIEDRIEDGISEEEAVASVGTVEDVILQIVEDLPLSKLVKQKINRKGRLKAWEIVLLILGSPIWLSIIIALLAVVLSLYISIWAVIICLWAVFVSLIACSVGGLFGGAVFCVTKNTFAGLCMIGAALVCAGLGILFFFVCKEATKGVLKFTKKIVLWTKKILLKKEEVK